MQGVRLPCLVSFRLAAGLVGWVGESRSDRPDGWFIRSSRREVPLAGWCLVGLFVFEVCAVYIQVVFLEWLDDWASVGCC